MVVGADQDQVGQLGGAAVFPVPDVVGVQAAGGAAPWDRARIVAVLEGAAKPPADHPGGPGGADGFAVALEPDLTGGITGQVLAFGLREQWTQMQRGNAALDVKVCHHGGVLPMGAAGGLGVPARFDQAHERVDSRWHRGPLIPGALAIVVVVFPLGDQRLAMRGHRRIELRRVVVGKCDPIAAARLVGGLGQRALGPRPRPRLGCRSRFELDRGGLSR